MNFRYFKYFRLTHPHEWNPPWIFFFCWERRENMAFKYIRWNEHKNTNSLNLGQNVVKWNIIPWIHSCLLVHPPPLGWVGHKTVQFSGPQFPVFLGTLSLLGPLSLFGQRSRRGWCSIEHGRIPSIHPSKRTNVRPRPEPSQDLESSPPGPWAPSPIPPRHKDLFSHTNERTEIPPCGHCSLWGFCPA